MKVIDKIILLWLLVTLVTSAHAETPPPIPPSEHKSEHPSCIIASGEIGGVYFPTAGAICRALKKTYVQGGIQHMHCSVEPTVGSVHNLMQLADKEVELGIAQSDSVRKAWEGQPPFQNSLKQLRSVVSLYTETLTLVTLAKSGIKRMEDLKGKRISLGTPGSGTEQTGLELLSMCKISSDMANIKTMDQESAAQALKKEEIDAYLYVVGHPNEHVWNITSTEKIAFMQLTGGCLEPLLVHSRRYVKTVIPSGMYPDIETDTPTFGIKATLMTTADVPENLIYNVTKSIVEKLYRFKKNHPDLEAPNPKTLFEGLIAPLHLGAFRYFQELRLLEFKETGHDIMSGLPGFIDKNGVLKSLTMTDNAPDALNAVKVLIGTTHDGEAGIPLTIATSPTISRDGSIYWLAHDGM